MADRREFIGSPSPVETVPTRSICSPRNGATADRVAKCFQRFAIRVALRIRDVTDVLRIPRASVKRSRRADYFLCPEFESDQPGILNSPRRNVVRPSRQQRLPFRFQPPSRLEAVAQHADEQQAIAIIRRSCSDLLLDHESNGLSFRKRKVLRGKTKYGLG
jgi:hypothetical protein